MIREELVDNMMEDVDSSSRPMCQAYFAVLVSPREVFGELRNSRNSVFPLLLLCVAVEIFAVFDLLFPNKQMIALGLQLRDLPAARKLLWAESAIALPLGILVRTLIEAKFIQWSAAMARRTISYPSSLLIAAMATAALTAQMFLAAFLTRISGLPVAFPPSLAPSVSTHIGPGLAANHFHLLSGSFSLSLLNMMDFGDLYKFVLIGVGVWVFLRSSVPAVLRMVGVVVLSELLLSYLIATTAANIFSL